MHGTNAYTHPVSEEYLPMVNTPVLMAYYVYTLCTYLWCHFSGNGFYRHPQRMAFIAMKLLDLLELKRKKKFQSVSKKCETIKGNLVIQVNHFVRKTSKYFNETHTNSYQITSSFYVGRKFENVKWKKQNLLKNFAALKIFPVNGLLIRHFSKQENFFILELLYIYI